MTGFHGHVAGCYELPTGEVVLDLTVADGNVFFFFPPDNKDMPSDGMEKRNKLNSPTMRWIFDPKAKKTAIEYPHGTVYVADERVTPAVQWRTNGEFSRIDDRYVTKPYRHFWQAVVDPTKPYDFAKCGPPAGGLFNCLGHYTWADEHFHDGSKPSSEVKPDGEKPKFGSEDVFFFSSTTTFQEPTFIPKDGGGEGEGYIIALLNHLDQLRNDIVVFDALNLSQGPLAIIHLPFKLKLGLHGNWVDNREIEAWKNRRAEGGDLGPVQAAKEMLPWQKAFFASRESEKAPKQKGEEQDV